MRLYIGGVLFIRAIRLNHGVHMFLSPIMVKMNAPGSKSHRRSSWHGLFMWFCYRKVTILWFLLPTGHWCRVSMPYVAESTLSHQWWEITFELRLTLNLKIIHMYRSSRSSSKSHQPKYNLNPGIQVLFQVQKYQVEVAESTKRGQVDFFQASFLV